eukprot:4887975-Pleurochrysis_carterae.AAC.1
MRSRGVHSGVMYKTAKSGCKDPCAAVREYKAASFVPRSLAAALCPCALSAFLHERGSVALTPREHALRAPLEPPDVAFVAFACAAAAPAEHPSTPSDVAMPWTFAASARPAVSAATAVVSPAAVCAVVAAAVTAAPA